MTLVGWLRTLVVLSVVVLLELLCRTGVINTFTMIAPSAMVVAMIRLIAAGKVGSDLSFTIINMLAAIALAIVFGFMMGSIIHALPRLRKVVDPLLGAYYAVPHFIFYPLLIVMFGLGRAPLIAIGTIFGVVGMAVSTIDGLDRIPIALRKTARAYRLNWWQTVFLIQLPAAAPHLFTGVKLAVTYCMIGVVAGEFILSMAGLGRSIAFAYNDLDNQSMYGLLLLLLSITTSINISLQAIEQRLYRRWHKS